MLNVIIGGDLALTSEIMEDAEELNVGEGLKSLLNKSDFNILNLEAPIIEESTPAEKYGPSLSFDSRGLAFLNKLKINALSLANNHIMDHGEQGLYSTIKQLENSSISYFGAGRDLNQAGTPYILSKNGLKVGFLNYAENEFSNTYGDQPGASPLDIIDNTLQIQALKKDVDKVILIIHGGAELHQYPSPRFKKLLEYFAEQGADAVIAHHTHRFNGFQIYKGKIPIVYGTGNFLFPQKRSCALWNTGTLCNLQIEKEVPISLELFPVKTTLSDKLEIRELNGEELESFSRLNQHIINTLQSSAGLEEKYLAFLKGVKSQYEHFLQPYTSKYLHKLYSMGLLPNFLRNNTKRLLYLNLIRCEAHRDVLLNILSR